MTATAVRTGNLEVAGATIHHELRGPTTRWKPDLAALHRIADRLVIGIGEATAGQLCDHASRALGAHLGIEPTLFPGDHIGFAEDPAAFVARMSIVIEDRNQPRQSSRSTVHAKKASIAIRR